VKKTLKFWSDDDKPREKLMNKGISVLSDAELIAILIGSGNKEETAVELARRILMDNDLNDLGKLSIKELTKYKGIGEAKAIAIVAAIELGKRRKSFEVYEKKIIESTTDIFEYMYPVLCDLEHEEFWAIYMNNSGKIIKRQKIAQGGITSTTVDLRLIMKSSIENLAVSIIICHNHPSGNVMPSEEDIKLTKKIKEACNTLNIKLLDHLIISGNNRYSFYESGILEL